MKIIKLIFEYLLGLLLVILCSYAGGLLIMSILAFVNWDIIYIGEYHQWLIDGANFITRCIIVIGFIMYNAYCFVHYYSSSR